MKDRDREREMRRDGEVKKCEGELRSTQSEGEASWRPPQEPDRKLLRSRNVRENSGQHKK